MFKPKGDIPTTDEMDEFDPKEPHAYDVMMVCGSCGEWSMFDKRGDSRTRKCQSCGNSQLGSIISYRTFNAERAKNESARIRKENEKRRARL